MKRVSTPFFGIPKKLIDSQYYTKTVLKLKRSGGVDWGNGVICFNIPDEEVVAPVLFAKARFNGSIYELERNNYNLTLLPSAARTTTTPSPDQRNYNARGLFLVFNVSSTPQSTATVQLVVEAKDPVFGYVGILRGSATASPFTERLFIYPGATNGDGLADKVCGLPLPPEWRVRVVHSEAGSEFVYSVGGGLIL